LRERRDRDRQQVEEAILRENRAQESLKCSESALQLAQESNDTQALGIAQDEIQRSKVALMQARAARPRAEQIRWEAEAALAAQ
jgi:hypothetical protein